jgi:hypothetical protein
MYNLESETPKSLVQSIKIRSCKPAYEMNDWFKAKKCKGSVQSLEAAGEP